MISIIFAALALVSPALAADIKHPNFPAKGGTVLGLASFTTGLAANRSSAEPAFQAINTGAGNSFEAYTPGGSYLFGQSVVGGATSPILAPLIALSVNGATTNSGVAYATTAARMLMSEPSGFVDIATSVNGGGDFDGAHVWVGKNESGRGGIKWESFDDDANAFLQFHSHRIGRGGKFAFGDAYNGGLNVTTLELRANGYVWDWRARSAQIGPQGSNTTGGWRWYIVGDGAGTMPIHTDWSDAAGNVLLRLNHAGGLQILASNSLTLGNGAIAAGNIAPGQDNTGAVGTSSARWGSIRAVTVTTGDLGFDDECCAVCRACFNAGDDVIWRIRRQVMDEQKRTVSYAVPIHVRCSK
jgi:hypothetical protein